MLFQHSVSYFCQPKIWTNAYRWCAVPFCNWYGYPIIPFCFFCNEGTEKSQLTSCFRGNAFFQHSVSYFCQPNIWTNAYRWCAVTVCNWYGYPVIPFLIYCHEGTEKSHSFSCFRENAFPTLCFLFLSIKHMNERLPVMCGNGLWLIWPRCSIKDSCSLLKLQPF